MSGPSKLGHVKATFFVSAAEFRAWLEQNHAQAAELLVGFRKVGSRRRGMTYPEALDEALCFGWIDGVRKSAGPDSYTIRFSPRTARSVWSLVNIANVERLQKLGRMHAVGLRAFEARDANQSTGYSFEQRPKAFPPQLEKIFRANKDAWAFWQQQPPGYQRLTISWVISAKQDATRERRLAQLILDSANRRRLNLLSPLRPR